ncbi:MAG: hypothetical protein M3256_25800 [Actinomycetota bacterium]|nr:hypothetical protein [Actinomycetota bacterium]
MRLTRSNRYRTLATGLPRVNGVTEGTTVSLLSDARAQREASRQRGVGPASTRRWEPWFPIATFIIIATVVVMVSVSAHALLPLLHRGHGHHRDWADAFAWWDGWWYSAIARHGYFVFSPHRQSPVAFFPAFPLLMRILGALVGNPMVAGVLLSLIFGLGDAVLVHRWCHDKLGPEKARFCVLVLLVYPFAFYLMGAVYADGLFLLTTLAAFLALEADRPVLSGLAAAAATASRPVGAALVLGLWVRALERRGILCRAQGSGPFNVSLKRPFRGRLGRADAGLLLAPFGLVAYLRLSGGALRPTASVCGRGRSPRLESGTRTAHVAEGKLVFSAVAVLGAAVSTKDFVGMGRYCIAAFPCFAAAGELLFLARRRVALAAMAGCGGTLLLLAELHARGTLVS